MAPTLFVGVSVLDGTGAAPFPGEVLVTGNRISAVSRGAGGLPRDGADLVDGAGGTLMPGLVECHAHLSFANTAESTQLGLIPPEEHTLLTARNAKLYLDHGFTSCVSAASAKARLDVVVRNAIDRGELPGPRLLAATPEMTVTGGLGDPSLSHVHRENFGVVCDGPDEFRKTARRFCRDGVDILKINPSGDEAVPWARAHQTVMTDAEVGAVAEVGRALGKRVAAHARSAESVKMCLRHGVVHIYHATLCDEEALDALEAHRDRVFVGPTIGASYATAFEASAWGITPEVAARRGLRRELELGIENMKALRRRGVRVVPGGDYGFAWNPHGANARDLEHFVRLLGFTPMEAILSATRTGGEMMGEGDRLGQVREGFLADLLLIDGDPLQDIRILQERGRLLAVMKDGAFHKAPVARRGASEKAA